MKKRIQVAVYASLLLTLSFASASAMAGAKMKNGFTYKVTKNQVKIISCSKNQKRIVIPDKIAGKKVTIGDKVEQINTPFIGCTNLKQFQAEKKETGYYAVACVLLIAVT